MSLFIDIFNVLNNRNERERITQVQYYEGTVIKPKFFQSDRLSLPRIPSFGINWEF
jgi:hypothetical protein